MDEDFCGDSRLHDLCSFVPLRLRLGGDVLKLTLALRGRHVDLRPLQSRVLALPDEPAPERQWE